MEFSGPKKGQMSFDEADNMWTRFSAASPTIFEGYCRIEAAMHFYEVVYHDIIAFRNKLRSESALVGETGSGSGRPGGQGTIHSPVDYWGGFRTPNPEKPSGINNKVEDGPAEARKQAARFEMPGSGDSPMTKVDHGIAQPGMPFHSNHNLKGVEPGNPVPDDIVYGRSRVSEALQLIHSRAMPFASIQEVAYPGRMAENMAEAAWKLSMASTYITEHAGFILDALHKAGSGLALMDPSIDNVGKRLLLNPNSYSDTLAYYQINQAHVKACRAAQRLVSAKSPDNLDTLIRSSLDLVANAVNIAGSWDRAAIPAPSVKESEMETRQVCVSIPHSFENGQFDYDQNRLADLKTLVHGLIYDLQRAIKLIAGATQSCLAEGLEWPSESKMLHLESMMRSGQHVNALVDAIVDTSGMPATELLLEPVDLSALSKELITRMIPAFPERRVRFEVEPGLNAIADQALVALVLERLLGNAIKYSKSEVETCIEVGREYRDKQMLFYVKDNGVGLTTWQAELVFGPFISLKHAGLERGHGLGLTIARRIIERHGGKVWAEGRLEEGTVIYFYLPGSAVAQ